MDHKIGVIPFDISGERIAIMFVTSQKRGRWILPKGTLKSGETHAGGALREAHEEAGLEGLILEHYPITLPITKMASENIMTVAVTYYPMLVTRQLDDWPEKDLRERHWALLNDAPKVTDRADYLNLIRQFDDLKSWILEFAVRKKGELRQTPMPVR